VKSALPRGIFLSCIGVLTLSPAPRFSPAQTRMSQRGVIVSTEKQPAANSGPGIYYALVIGLSNYKEYPALHTPNNDATQVASVLQHVYGFKTEVLLDANRQQIMDAFSRYQHTPTDADSLLIYIAGHGFNNKKMGITYLLPVDAGKDSYNNWITNQEITGTVRAVPAKHVLVIADTCFSGTLRAAAGTGDADADQILDLKDLTYLDKMKLIKSRNVLASGGDEPVSDGDGHGLESKHSIFASVLLQNLSKTKDSEFTGGDLYQKVVHEVTGQTPQYDAISECSNCAERGDFVFHRLGTASTAAIPVEQFNLPVHQRNPDEDAVKTALDTYQEAYTSMDLHELRKAWPSLSKSQEKEIKGGFQAPGLQAVKVELRNRVLNVASDTAVAKCDQWMIYTFEGRRQPPQTSSVEISLMKDPHGAWTVNGVKGR
jgi:hypothetical protein